MANRTLKQSTAANVMVFMTQAADHISGATGLTLTITSSADGAAFGSITPTVTERGNGWYGLALTTGHTATLGDLCLHITSAGADPTDLKLHVIAVDLADATALGLSLLDAAITSRMATFTLPANFSSLAITGGGAVTASSLIVKGAVVAGSTSSSVTVSGLPTNASFAGQHVYRYASGEGRVIATDTVSGSNHILTFSGSGTAAPFGSAPSAGESMGIVL